jgi:hypothetical protein
VPLDSLGDLGRFGNAAASLVANGLPKSICFSNAPSPGVNTPAGARLFGVEMTGVPANQCFASTNHSDQWTGFRVFEFNSAGLKIRQFDPGLLFGTGDRRSITYPVPHTPDYPDGTPCNGSDVGGFDYLDPIRVGTIRYNPARNTIAISCNVLDNIGQENETVKARVYEFELPDWPEATPPVVRTSAADIRLVQVYEMPAPHSILPENGNFYNSGPLVIDFDDVGNMYCTSVHFNATQTYAPGIFRGDVIRVNTLGRNGGATPFVVSVTGADAANLLISAEVEANLGHTAYGGAWGMALRRDGNGVLNQLVLACRTNCDASIATHIYDLTQRVGGGSTGNLVLVKAFTSDVTDTPRQGNFAQRDEASGKIYFGHQLGSCTGGPHNFTYLNSDSPTDTIVKDVGFSLSINCSSVCTLPRSWDAASPPPAPGPAPTGACCLPTHACESLTFADCRAAGGAWQGAGVACGQFPCEGACCNGPCNACSQSIYYECIGTGKTFHGLGTLCGQVACPFQCAAKPVDGDCDGDIDLTDFANFQLCYNPGGPILTTPANCACFDTAAPANEIDKLDFDAFVNCAQGSRDGVPAQQPCP